MSDSSEYLEGITCVHEKVLKRDVAFPVGARKGKGVLFLSKMLYKIVRVWSSGQSLPIQNFV